MGRQKCVSVTGREVALCPSIVAARVLVEWDAKSAKELLYAHDLHPLSRHAELKLLA